MKFCSLYPQPSHRNRVENLLDLVPHIDASISHQGHRLLDEKYLLPDETANRRLANACVAFGTSFVHSQRLAEYIRKGWFMFATPLLTNGGTTRGLPISCYLNYVPDSLEGLADHYRENIFLSTSGGGIGAHWSDVRSKGSETSAGSETSGIIPFIKVADSQVLAFKQGVTRAGAYAAYLDVSHPEILEYLGIRSADGGAVARKSLHIHIGVCLSDAFMQAVEYGDVWDLIDPHSKVVTDTVLARDIWGAILSKRMTDRGEPYLFFSDTANEASPYVRDERIHGSNLCTEIMLHTSEEETAVCCLSSLNAAHYDEWKHDGQFIADIVEMLDNALTVFIANAPPELAKAVLSAERERSIGIGLMGLHTYLQKNNLAMSSSNNDWRISQHISDHAAMASVNLGRRRGIPHRCGGIGTRNLHRTAIAPNSSSATMLGVSPGVEPWRANVFTEAKDALFYEVRNQQLGEIFNELGNPEDLWEEVRLNHGSVQKMTVLTDKQKAVFKTFAEINQLDIVDRASRRQPYIDQGQSINLCFNADADPKYINEVHLAAWKGCKDGAPLKSLYYVRTNVVDKVEDTSVQAKRGEQYAEDYGVSCPLNPEAAEECLACQG